MNEPSKLPEHVRVDGIWDVPESYVEEAGRFTLEDKRRVIAEVLTSPPTQQQSEKNFRARALGLEAEQLLIKVLRLPKSFLVPQALLKAVPKRAHCDAEKALSMIRRGIHPELVLLLKPYAATADERLRRAVAGHLAAFGSDAVLGALGAALHDASVWVSSSAKQGLGEAVDAGRASPRFKERAWECLEQELRDPTVAAMYDPLRYLMKIDPARAAELIQGPDFLRPDHPILEIILGTLYGLRIPVRGDFLLSLAAQEFVKAGAFRREPFASTLLFCLAFSGLPEAREIVERAINEGNTRGYEALEILDGIGNFTKAALAAYRAAGNSLHGLPPSAQDIVLVNSLEHVGGEYMEEGGFPDAFGNALSDDPVRLVDSLQRMGGNEHAALLIQAMTVFAPDGTWLSLPERQAKIGADEETQSEASDEEEAEDDDGGSVFWELGEKWRALRPIHELIARYSWEHRADGALLPPSR